MRFQRKRKRKFSVKDQKKAKTQKKRHWKRKKKPKKQQSRERLWSRKEKPKTQMFQLQPPKVNRKDLKVALKRYVGLTKYMIIEYHFIKETGITKQIQQDKRPS